MDIAKGLLAIGEVEAAATLAREQLEETAGDDYRTAETGQAIRLLAAQGYEGDAVRYAQDQKSAGERCDVLSEIAQALASAKRRPQCFRVAHEALLTLAEQPGV
jgi:hypothetical protein